MRACAPLLAGALLLSASVAAQARDDLSLAQIEQRIRLTARLIADSPTAQRIGASGQRDAVAHFDEGRVHQALAEDLLARGDLPGARRAVDEALRHISMARRLVPDARTLQAAARQRYEQLQASVSRLIDAWRARAGTSSAESGELLQATSLLDAARYLEQDSRFEEANQTLAAAERQVLAGMTRLLNATTLDYTERAATPAEELKLELVRHKSLTELLPLALSELRPAPDAVALIERYQDMSQSLRAQAVQTAQRGDAAQALVHIRSAILYLQRALAAAGVTTPPPIGSLP